ncbi:MAG: histidine triad nucleotide-binding protein [Buchnera aphidicola (Nurudea yanoniella)]
MENSEIFKNIIKRKISSEILYQDKNITAFKDINPKAPVHILVVSNKFIRSSNEITKENKGILGDMLYVAIKLAKKFNIDKKGYRLIMNCNEHGGQEIFHLHLHLLGGKKLGKI